MPKDSDTKADEPTQDDMLMVMLKAFFLAFFSGPKTEEALNQLKEADVENDGVATQVAQTVLASALTELLENPTFAPFVNRQHPVVEKANALIERLDRLFENGVQEILARMLAPHGQLTERLKKDFPNEKKELANYVVKTFFRDESRRCFIQASTTAIELGLAIIKDPGIAHGNLFHTNSIFFPLTVLRERCPHWVYTFCGSIYDPLCGGWLFPSNDTETTGRLRELFDRAREPLDTVFLTPITTTAEGQMYFLKDETAHLAATILSTKVQHVVIMTIAQRVSSRVRDGEKFLSVPWLDCLSKGKTVSLVMTGRPRESDPNKLAKAFAQKKVSVHYCSGPGGEWGKL